MVRKISSESKLIDKYLVGENEIFQVSIYENPDKDEKHFIYSLNINSIGILLKI